MLDGIGRWLARRSIKWYERHAAVGIPGPRYPRPSARPEILDQRVDHLLDSLERIAGRAGLDRVDAAEARLPRDLDAQRQLGNALHVAERFREGEQQAQPALASRAIREVAEVRKRTRARFSQDLRQLLRMLATRSRGSPRSHRRPARRPYSTSFRYDAMVGARSSRLSRPGSHRTECTPRSRARSIHAE